MSTPDPRVLRALATPLIGQFDPEFTAIMDDVVQLARQTFITSNTRCFAVSGLASAGLEAVLNTLIEEGDEVAIGGSPQFYAATAEVARRYGARVSDSDPKFLIVPFIDPWTGHRTDLQRPPKVRLVVDATLGLGACELRVDDWGIDVCVAGVDHAVGAPAGMTLVTYTSDIEACMAARTSPPRTSYLDLLQLQAYWSPERLNHHTAPTSLVYGVREALRLLVAEGLTNVWQRHASIGQLLRDGLGALGLQATGDLPYSILRIANEAERRQRLLEDFGIHVSHLGDDTWRLGLLGADARPDVVHRLLAALEKILKP